MSKNKIATYQLIDEDLLRESGFRINPTYFTYHNLSNSLEYIRLEEDDEIQETLYLNELEDKWSPLTNDLTIHQLFTIKDPSIYFGKNGVTSDSNMIGIGVHIHSTTTNIQMKRSIGSFGRTTEPIEIKFEEYFPKNKLRGRIFLDFFYYLEEVNETNNFQAKEKGMLLSDDLLLTLELVIDGDGSVFPISEVSDKGGPLWTLEKYWADPIEDQFDNNNVSLKLNKLHPMFKVINDSTSRYGNFIMEDIIIHAMALIIQEVVLDENLNVEEYEVSGNSILTVVKYWIETFEVDITNRFSILNSLKRELT